MSYEFVLAIAGIAVLVVADRRLKAAAQPLRLRLAEKGERFLSLPDIPDHAKKHISFLLGRAFGMRGSLILALFAIPIIAVLFVVRQKSILKSVEKLKQLKPTERAEFFEICRLHDRITLVNHWILLPIVELELVLFMPMAILLRGIIQGRIPETGGRESVISYIEDKRIHGLHLRHSHATANIR